MFTVFDEFNLVWCQTKCFALAQRVAEYMLSQSHTPRVEQDAVEPLLWRSEGAFYWLY
ncbi:MAG: hypothetical protein VB071_14385 [Lawsonibacter sp.]|nr:hypothetical protein [Lawsonibacter sp.]